VRLNRASVSRPSGQWNDDDFDVLANGEVVGRIYKANAAPVGSPWMWTLAFGHQKVAARRRSTAETFAKLLPHGSYAQTRQHLWAHLAILPRSTSS
jgi:hypothetical protein